MTCYYVKGLTALRRRSRAKGLKGLRRRSGAKGLPYRAFRPSGDP